jgi:hypothetical protein
MMSRCWALGYTSIINQVANMDDRTTKTNCDVNQRLKFDNHRRSQAHHGQSIKVSIGASKRYEKDVMEYNISDS